MDLNRDQIRILLKKSLAGTINAEEKVMLQQWIDNQLLKDNCEVTGIDEEELRTRMLNKILAETSSENNHSAPLIKRMNWRKIALIAATISIFVALGLYILKSNLSNSTQVQSQVVTYVNPDQITALESIAILTLENGDTIKLNPDEEGIAIKDHILVYENGGRMNKKANEEKSGDSNQLLTLSTPKGTIYKVTLPDGTEVWLNANSKISYPRSFSQHERKVLFSGEGYFSVAKDKTKPFKVISSHQEINVLGTSFNVQDDNKQSLTTLIEGSVKIRPGEYSPTDYTVLKPNDQAVVKGNNVKVKQVDIKPIIAWKDGLFYFDGLSPQAALNQIANWYNLEVVYQDKVPQTKFFGVIDRKKSLGSILKILEKSGMKFKVQYSNGQNKLIVIQE